MLIQSSNAQPAVITGLFQCGHVQNFGDDESTEVIIIALEASGKTFYVRDALPVHHGSALHRLAEAVTGFTLNVRTVQPDDLLGCVVLAEIVPTETFSALRTLRTFPRPPRYAPREVQFVTRDPILGGSPDKPAIVGGSVPRSSQNFPAAPVPSVKPLRWDARELRKTVLPESLPRCVSELVQRSLEWQALIAKKGK